MAAASRIAGALALAGMISGCGVPRLYSAGETGAEKKSPTPKDAKTDLAPKVHHIIDEITCELADIHKYQLKGKSYLVTILLTLQVDDNLDVTPSLSLLRSLSGGTESEVTTLSADVGGGRRRTFTTTYYIDTDKLPDDGCPPGDGNGKLLRLDGNLGLFEIARDGRGVLSQASIHEVKPGTSKDDKALSTFGSLVQFTVTRGVMGLGPTWTLKRFKGPSGQNGLVNGKRLNTDSVALTFAPIIPASKSDQADADVKNAQDNKNKARAGVVGAANLLSARLRTRDLILKLNLTGKRQLGKMSFGDANAEVDTATAALNAANETERAADSALRDALAEREATEVARFI